MLFRVPLHRFFLLLPAGRWLLPLLALLVINGATGTFAYHLYRQDRDDAQFRFSIDAAIVTVEIRDRLRQHSQFLQGLRAFVTSVPELKPADWERFSRMQDAHTHLSGLQAFGFLPAVPQEGLHAFSAQARETLKQPGFHVFPPSEAALRFPVYLLWPLSGGNARGLGYDLSTEPTRQEAMEQSRDRNDLVMSRRLQLVLDGPDSQRPGFIMFLPIYEIGQDVSNVVQRRKALKGYVFAAYRMSDLMQTLNHAQQRGLRLQIFDDWGFDSSKGGAQLALMYDAIPDFDESRKNMLSEERELGFGTRNWLLRFEEHHPFDWFSSQNPSSIVLVSGIILSVLTALLLWLLTRQGQNAMALAQGMTSKLEQSRLIFRLAAEGANDGLWYRNFQQNHWFFSERAMVLLGQPKAPYRTGEDLLLKLLHPDDANRRQQALEAHLRQGTPYDLEVRLKRPDGSWGWIQLKGQATWDDEGHPALMAGAISDIHHRKQTELELLQHRDHLQDLVDERTQRLENALMNAREAVRAKSEFLANMSHELRTPLHAMLGFANIGQSKAQGQEKLNHYFERIHQSAERLLSLVNDLLDLAKLEAKKMEVLPTQQDIQRLCIHVIEELAPLLQKKSLTTRFEIHTEDLVAMADPTRFAQVLHNLLSNAIRFSPEHGCITLRLSDAQLPAGRRSSDQGLVLALSVCVEDRGPGIPEAELRSIFDKFAQSSRTRTGAGGTGLGLAICEEIMLAHRGRIYATHNPLGGARLIATLPREFEPLTQEDARP